MSTIASQLDASARAAESDLSTVLASVPRSPEVMVYSGRSITSATLSIWVVSGAKTGKRAAMLTCCQSLSHARDTMQEKHYAFSLSLDHVVELIFFIGMRGDQGFNHCLLLGREYQRFERGRVEVHFLQKVHPHPTPALIRKAEPGNPSLTGEDIFLTQYGGASTVNLNLRREIDGVERDLVCRHCHCVSFDID